LTVLACAALYAVPGQPPAAQTAAAVQAQPAVPNVNGRMVFPNVRVENAPAPVDQPSAAQGQRAFIDPVTRQLREPTPEEIVALEQAGALKARTLRLAAPTVVVEGSDGSATAILGDEYMVYTVATTGANGKVSMDHATGPKDAAVKMNTKAPAKAGKGADHDR
jgi:hypothetical protein